MNTSDSSNSTVFHAGQEARGLLELLRNGESIESVRTLIGASPERRATLVAFNSLALDFLRSRPDHSRCGNKIPAWQRREMIRLMKLGWTDKQVVKKIGCSPQLARRVRMEWTGKTVDRRFGRTLSAKELSQARERLHDGEGWKVVAVHFGIGETKLRKLLAYRKRTDPGAKIRLTREKYNQLVAELRTGNSISRILRDTHTSCYTLMRIQRKEGIRPVVPRVRCAAQGRKRAHG